MGAPLARRGPTTGSALGPAAAVVALGAVGAVGVGAAVGATAAGTPRPGNPLAYVIELGRGNAVWPGTVATAVTAALLLVLAAVVVLVVVKRAGGVSDREVRGKARYLAQARDLDGLTKRSALVRARGFRPSLPRRGQVPVAATGVVLGQLLPAGGPVIASWEDVLLAVMAPRSWKTTAIAIPAVLNAPGAVVATSMKPDLHDATAAVRAGTGRVWRFDPQRIVAGGQTMWWNPLAGITSIDTARLLAAHFCQEISAGGSDADFWSNAALNVLANLLLAAGVAGGSLRDVWRWINDSTATRPVEILRAAGLRASAAGLTGTGSGAPETREGIYENVRTACACLADEAILPWVTPPPKPPRARAGEEDEEETDEQVAARTGIARFRPENFVTSPDTLYLLSQDDAGAAQPLVAALVDALARAATQTANRQPNRRLDPPLVLVLDEAANICKIRRLPQLYSHLGSRSVVPVTILQSYDQAELVWGERGARALWSAATVKLFGAGLDSPTLTDTLSKLVGDHDVTTTSVGTGGGSRNGGGGRTQNTSVTRERIFTAGDVRNLPKGCAILLATGHRPAMLQLQPWYRGPQKTAVTAALKAVAAQAAADLAAARATAAAEAAGAAIAGGGNDSAVPADPDPDLPGDLDDAGAPVDDATTEPTEPAPAAAVGGVAGAVTAAAQPAGTAAFPAVTSPTAAAAVDWDTLDWDTVDWDTVND